MAIHTNKRPRHFAADIIALPSRDARKQALAAVPEHWQGLVCEHVTSHFALTKSCGVAA